MADPEKKKARYAAKVVKIKAKQEKKARAKGGRYEKAGERKEKQAVKHASKSVSTKNPVKKTMQSEKAAAARVSAARLKTAGAKAKKTGKTPPKKKAIVTTARSAHKQVMANDPHYTGHKRLRKNVKGF
jgi:hypothetical protein